MGCGDSRVVPPSLPKKPVSSALLQASGLVEAVRPHSPEKVTSFDTSLDNGEDEEEDDFDDVEFEFITEKSEPDVVAKVVREFVPIERADDLIIIGVACSRLMSAIQRMKLEEERILETLRNEGLIARPLKRSPNATGFEIVEENADRKQKFVPAAIREREQRTEKAITNEAILEKLARAGERRKQQEAEKKARAVTAKPRGSLQIQQREEEQAELLRNEQLEKYENTLRNRELHLMDIQEKLKEKHQRIKGLHFKRSFKGFADPFEDN